MKSVHSIDRGHWHAVFGALVLSCGNQSQQRDRDGGDTFFVIILSAHDF